MSHWHLTTGELTLAAPLLGAPIGALIAYFASRWTTKTTTTVQKQLASESLIAQRQLAHDAREDQFRHEQAARLWERRSAFYGEILVAIDAIRDLTWLQTQTDTFSFRNLHNDLTSLLSSLLLNTNDVAAFAGDSVADQFLKYRNKLEGVLQRISLRAIMEESYGSDALRLSELIAENKPAMLEDFAQVKSLRSSLRWEIRRELQDPADTGVEHTQ